MGLRSRSARNCPPARTQALAKLREDLRHIAVVTYSDGTMRWIAKRDVNSKFLGIVAREPHSNILNCGRHFHCHGESLIFRDGFGYGKSQDVWQQESPLQIPFDWMVAPSTQVFQWLQEQWRIASSEVRIYWEWNRKSKRERYDWLSEMVPRWGELNDLMRAAAIVAQLPPEAHWILDHVDTHNQTPELLARLQPWREVLMQHFPPFAPLAKSYPQFLRNYFRDFSEHIQCVGRNASAHEQLEARLHLRDWLKHNAPDKLFLVQ